MNPFPDTPNRGEGPFLSVIIPALNEPEIMDTVHHLRQSLEGVSYEIIIVDGDPEGSTIRLCETSDCRTLLSLPGRARQMNRGSDLARGEVLLFHHADTLLPAGGGRLIQRSIRKGAEAGAFRLSFSEGGMVMKLIASMANLRNRFTREPFGDQSFFIRRERYQEVGPYKTIPVMEDVEYMKRLKRDGIPVVILPRPVRTSPRRWKKEGAGRTTLKNWACQLLYGMGVSPWKLARLYSGKEKTAGESVLALMYRAPEKGKVKSRLAAGVGDRKALEIYQALLDHSITVLRQVSHRDRRARPILYLNGKDDHSILEFEVWKQNGADLGERMLRFFYHVFTEKGGRAILFGSDIPEIGDDVLCRGLKLLEEKDSIIGPARDGGYYCIGFNRDTFYPECFQDIPWGTDKVFRRVSEILEGAGQDVGILPELGDIDDRVDLDAYLENPNKANITLARRLKAIRNE